MYNLREWNRSRSEIDHVVTATSSSSTSTTANESSTNAQPVLQPLDDMINYPTVESIPSMGNNNNDEIIFDTINTCKTSYYYYSIRSLFRNHRKYKLTDGLTKIPSSIKPDESISTTNVVASHRSIHTISPSQHEKIDTSLMSKENQCNKNEEKCNNNDSKKKKAVNVTIETNNIHMNDDDDENNTVLETPSPTNTDDEFDDYNEYNIGNDDSSNIKRMNQKFFRRGRLV
jgi:hypothetical protein